MPRRARGLGPQATQTWEDIRQAIQADPSILTPVPRPAAPPAGPPAALSAGPGLSGPDREGFVWIMSAASEWPEVKGDPPWHRNHVIGYNADQRKVRTIFRDGTPWAYYDVPPEDWEALQGASSTGKFINAVLNKYPYGRESFRPPRPYRKWPR